MLNKNSKSIKQIAMHQTSVYAAKLKLKGCLPRNESNTNITYHIKSPNVQILCKKQPKISKAFECLSPFEMFA